MRIKTSPSIRLANGLSTRIARVVKNDYNVKKANTVMKTYSILRILPLVGFYAIVTNALAFEKTGTGFAVAPDMILTAYHVVESGELISVSFGETSYPATMTAFNKDLDWALLKMSGNAPGTVSIGNSSKVTLGESVYSLGYPASDILGDEIKYAKGEIGALSGLG